MDQVSATAGRTNWQAAVERTVTGLNYDLVDVERAAGGLLRVTIDRVPGQAYDTGASEFVTVDDCEVVNRQLQLSLEVDGVDYLRLEVSSPGLDRPLKKVADYQRFAGTEVEVTLRLPFQGRKKWRGLLQPREGGWRLEMPPAPVKGKPGKVRPPAEEGGERAFDFTLDEVREARLVPVLDFKGRKNKAAAAEGAARDDGGSDR